MNWFVYHIASGTAFFSGVAFIVLAAALGMSWKRWGRRIAPFCAIVGLLAIAVSATPLPGWYYALGASVSVAWFVALGFQGERQRWYRGVAAGLFAAVWVIGGCVELPYHLRPTLRRSATRTVTVFGDSVTAGIGEGEAETWPRILARTQTLTINDYSRMGATVASAFRDAQQASIAEGIVIVEIGGNDLLGSTAVRDFEENLDRLLSRLSGWNRQVIMFELPLPPLGNSYGRVQRRLAGKHGVALIPKRIFMRVLAADGATLDSIHLSQEGHNLMAASVWRILQPALTL